MELEYSDKNSKRSKVYIFVGVLMALMVAGIVFVALQASVLTKGTDVVMREVVVAIRDIPSRKPMAPSSSTTSTGSSSSSPGRPTTNRG